MLTNERGINATARVTILMTPQEKKTLPAQAKRSGSPSVDAYLRRKALGPEDPTLDALIELVQKSTERASAALGQVLTAMQHDEPGAPARRRRAGQGCSRDACVAGGAPGRFS